MCVIFPDVYISMFVTLPYVCVYIYVGVCSITLAHIICIYIYIERVLLPHTIYIYIFMLSDIDTLYYYSKCMYIYIYMHIHVFAYLPPIIIDIC